MRFASLAIGCSLLLAGVGGAAFAQPASESTTADTEQASVPSLLVGSELLVRWLAVANADVRAAAERVNQASADRRQAGVLPNPALSFQVGDITIGQTNPPGLPLSQTTAFTWGLSEVVEIGKREPRQRSAELKRGAAGEDYIGTLGKTTADARLALGKIAYLRLKQAVLDDNLQAARGVAGLEHARANAGDISGNDYERIVLDTQSFELDVARNKSDLSEAMGECRTVMASRCNPNGVVDDLIDRAAELPSPLPEADGDLAQRWDLRSWALQAESARADADLARARAIPDPDLQVSLTHDNLTVAGNQPNSFTVGFSIPLPFFDTGSHDASKAESHARELEQTARGALLDAQSDVEGLEEREHWLSGAIDTLRKDAIPRSVMVLEATRKAFDTGHVSLSDLLLAEKTHRELTIKLLDLRWELFQARNELRRTLGLDEALARRVLSGTPAPGQERDE